MYFITIKINLLRCIISDTHLIWSIDFAVATPLHLRSPRPQHGVRNALVTATKMAASIFCTALFADAARVTQPQLDEIRCESEPILKTYDAVPKIGDNASGRQLLIDAPFHRY
jgi:hypothetical protein